MYTHLQLGMWPLCAHHVVPCGAAQDMECLVKLMATIGATIDTPKNQAHMVRLGPYVKHETLQQQQQQGQQQQPQQQQPALHVCNSDLP